MDVSASSDAAESVTCDPRSDLTRRALTAAIDAALPHDQPPPGVANPPPSAPPDVDLLAQMRETADPFGFRITANRPILGVPHLKRALRRLQYQVFARQSDFNQAATAILDRLVVSDRENAAERRIALRTLTAADERLRNLEQRLDEALAANARLRREVETQRVARTETSPPAVHDLDYLGLQARFRGTAEEITERQRAYLDRFAAGATVLDIGCGRGEFLALLRESGRQGVGVDTDADMVALCRAAGLEVSQDNGLSHLKGLSDDSLDGVFAAQVIEHLPPEQIAFLIQTALRKLRPGGMLVLETVNPTSLVALMNFYLDFTHVAPVHPFALSWLAESIGFVDTETLYLSEVTDGPRLRPFPGTSSDAAAQERFDDAIERTNEILYGPRDYALLARRP